MDIAAFRLGMSAQVDGPFKGESAAATHRGRETLLAEAQNRFGKNPTTRAAGNKYLNHEAAAPGVPR